MARTDPAAELLAKDRRIDDLVAQAEALVSDLNATVADMRRILAAAQANVERQKQISAEGEPA
jgi:ABC-type transporter Mla subunit MlaD